MHPTLVGYVFNPKDSCYFFKGIVWNFIPVHISSRGKFVVFRNLSFDSVYCVLHPIRPIAVFFALLLEFSAVFEMIYKSWLLMYFNAGFYAFFKRFFLLTMFLQTFTWFPLNSFSVHSCTTLEKKIDYIGISYLFCQSFLICFDCFFRSFSVCAPPPPPPPPPQVIEHVPLHKKLSCSNMACASRGANYMRPLSWRGTKGKDPFFLVTEDIMMD